MRNAVLADVGPLYAAVDFDDTFHHQVQEEIKRLEREDRVVVIAYSTLVESYTLIMRRLGLNAAHTWLDEAQSTAILSNPTVDDYAEAMVRVRRYKDQPLTLHDAVLAAMGARLECPIWTYDFHFDLMRAPIWR